MTDLSPSRISELARATAPSPLDALNSEQRAAVEATEGPVLVLAGAGTGKTRVLTTRLTHLLDTGKARPWELLAVTFTNKAAREMRHRIGEMIGPAAEGLRWLGTFHAIAAQILRRHADLVGLKSSFTIIDVDDQERLIKQLLAAEGSDAKRWTPKHLAGLIDRWKNRGWTPDQLPAAEGAHFANGRGQALYAQYQDRLRILNACDFGDLLLHNLTIFTRHPDVLAEFHRRFRYILVDEYQDTNVAQYLWLRLLAQASHNICCVGDDDQSIYGWRGAEVDNILRFERDFPGAKVIRLERNYRSTSHILAAASGLIAANKDRLGKTLWTEAEGGQKVQVRGVWDGEAESRLVAEEIERWRKARPYHDVAILVRASFQMLRAGGNPRRPRLSAAGAIARRRSGLRADHQHAPEGDWGDEHPEAARPRQRSGRIGRDRRPGARQQRRASGAHPHGAFDLSERHRSVASRLGGDAPCPPHRDDSGGERLYRRPARG